MATSKIDISPPREPALITGESPADVRGLPMPDLRRLIGLDDAEFLRLCEENRPLKIERQADGAIVIMAPTGSEGSGQNATLVYFFVAWNRQTKLGQVFDSNGGFRIPNSAVRAADVAWVRNEVWESLTSEQRDGFAPIVPDFVLELLSPSDSRPQGRAKMEEWIEAGVRLAWLIDPQARTVAIYRPGRAPEILTNPAEVAGDADVLPGFVLPIAEIWGEPAPQEK